MNSPSTPSRKKVRPCWEDRGYSDEAARQADAVLPTLLALIKDRMPFVLRDALEEALFRVRELPRRTKKFQAAYLKKNGAQPSHADRKART